MWAFDGAQITTVHDGKVWLLATVERWNADAPGTPEQIAYGWTQPYA
ncbi:hypothetical protein [Elioraea sp.]|jgi:hypothetical protein|nr:hypothetical protein [Elioraea sp.]GIX08612.1 MAG: hypothetical protein KatS3mg116_0322 [Elioraea sp.]